MRSLLSSASALAIGSALSVSLPATAQDRPRVIEEVVVTATKREEGLQDVPVAVQAFSEETLNNIGIDTFQDYLLAFPGVTAGSNGPGQGTIYIRGVASTTPNNNVATASGVAPNVALYLDEQPLTQVGRNLDIYAADLNRIEVLPGPQGTLFGASSQAGTVRLITNMPSFEGFSARLTGEISATKSGEMSEKIEAVINVPVIEDRLAIRGVLYNDNQGGYIDNVRGMRTAAESGRFAPGGFQEGADLSGVEFLPVDNVAVVEDDFNDTTYTGGRVSLAFRITPDWDATVVHSRQKLNADGVFAFDPSLDDEDELSVQRFVKDRLEDSFHNTAWTIEGRTRYLDIVYTGSYLDRDVDQLADYTDYLFVGQYIPYYICDGSVSYPGDAAPSGTCQAPLLFNDLEVESRTQTHELRFNTPAEERIRATFGGFYSDQEVTERGNFTYTGSPFAESFTPGVFGFAPNSPVPGASVSDPSTRQPPVIFFNDLTRSDRQIGVFGEATAEIIPDTLSATFGLRYYDIEVDLVGAADFSFGNFGAATDNNAFSVNLDRLFNGVQDAGEPLENGDPLPDTADTSGVIFKGNLSWTPTEDLLFYFTYSEGFRPGLLNRPGGTGSEATGFVPGAVDSDEVRNYEIGWKTEFFDNSLRFNGSAFLVDITGLQISIFNPAVGTNLNFAANGADAEVMGIEGDFVWLPYAVPGLSIAGAFSILETEITALSLVTGTSIAPVGSELSFAPGFQGNLRVRYEWNGLPGFTTHVQSVVTYTGESFSDIVVNPERRVRQDSYTVWNLAAGLRNERWSAEIFMDNVLDTRAEIFNNSVYRNPGNSPDYTRTITNRPRTGGLRVTVDF